MSSYFPSVYILQGNPASSDLSVYSVINTCYIYVPTSRKRKHVLDFNKSVGLDEVLFRCIKNVYAHSYI